MHLCAENLKKITIKPFLIFLPVFDCKSDLHVFTNAARCLCIFNLKLHAPPDAICCALIIWSLTDLCVISIAKLMFRNKLWYFWLSDRQEYVFDLHSEYKSLFLFLIHSYAHRWLFDKKCVSVSSTTTFLVIFQFGLLERFKGDSFQRNGNDL